MRFQDGPDEIGFRALVSRVAKKVDGRQRRTSRWELAAWELSIVPTLYANFLSARHHRATALTAPDARESPSSAHPIGAQIARTRRPRLSALPQGVGAAPERPRRPGDRRRGVSDQGAARRYRRADPALAGGRQHPGSRRAEEPRRVPRPRRRAVTIHPARVLEPDWFRTIAAALAERTTQARGPCTWYSLSRERYYEGQSTGDGDEIYYDLACCPTSAFWRAYTPKPGGAQTPLPSPPDEMTGGKLVAYYIHRKIDLRTHHRRRRAPYRSFVRFRAPPRNSTA